MRANFPIVCTKLDDHPRWYGSCFNNSRKAGVIARKGEVYFLDREGAAMDHTKTEATRYLCAAAYLDSSFRDRVINQLIHNVHRAIGPCYGINLEVVLRHCTIAKERLFHRDIALFFLLALASILILLHGGLVLPFLLLLVAWAVVFDERYDRLYNILGEKLSRHGFAQEEPESATPLAQVGHHAGNTEVIVYSGFSPFPGSGSNISSWSFSANIQRGKEEFGNRLTPDDFTVEELYEQIQSAITSMELANVALSDVVCIHGRDVQGDSRFLPDPLAIPVTRLGGELLPQLLRERSHKARYYQRIQVVDWSGELILSVFLRFYKLKANLFVEASFFLLTPIQEHIHAVDSQPTKLSVRQLAGLVVTSAFLAPFACIGSAFSLYVRLIQPWERRRQCKEARRAILERQDFDYGAEYSIREMASSGAYRRYFQKLDKELYMKTIERQILDTIITFLDERNIDTSDLKERQTVIQNSGVVVSGGQLSTENLAVGHMARAAVKKVAGIAKSMGGAPNTAA
jgi:hypothetical protein